MCITSEGIAYWYLRLNGFMTIVNFLVHPENKRDFCTEVDILGVRFPNRSENLFKPMIDDSRLLIDEKSALIVLTEVKSGRCSLNGPWVQPEKRNMEKVLRAIGSFKINRNKFVAKSLYENGIYLSKSYNVTMVCMGNERNFDIETKYPRVPQIIFKDALSFIYERLTTYSREKVQHSQWDSNGKYLWDRASQAINLESFCSTVLCETNLRA